MWSLLHFIIMFVFVAVVVGTLMSAVVGWWQHVFTSTEKAVGELSAIVVWALLCIVAVPLLIGVVQLVYYTS